MGLPPALHGKCCASDGGAFFPHPWPFLGLAWVLFSFPATNRVVHRSFPARSLTSLKKKKKKGRGEAGVGVVGTQETGNA